MKFGPLFKQGDGLVSNIIVTRTNGNQEARAVFQKAEDGKLYLMELVGPSGRQACDTPVGK